MWCTKRRLEPFEVPVSLNSARSCELIQSEFLEKSPVNEFMFQEIEISGRKTFRVTSDIYMLFNQQRLDRMSKERLISYFESLSVNEPKLHELRSKLTDDQLCSFVKSRFIQSPSELMAWSRYLMSSQDEMIAAAAAEEHNEEPEPPVEVDPPQEP